MGYTEGMGAADNIAIVLLPGMDGSGLLLTDLVERLALQRPVRVISYPNEPLSYDDLIEFVVGRIPHSRFVILGESFSGPIAIEVAATQPRVAGLILASSFARHPMPKLFMPLAAMLNLRWVPTRIVEAALLGSAGKPDLRENLGRVLAKLPREVVTVRAREVFRVDKRKRLRAVTCPMLCLQGRFDRLVRKKRLDEITSSHQNCEVRVFDAPHMLLQTHSAEAAIAINQFATNWAS
jgi:pimeloyl-[acyl-carrier protein] methyl ester esterase